MNSFASRWPALLGKATDPRKASVLLEATALAHGLDTVRINGNSFVAGEHPLFTTIGFWGPLSSETSRAAVRITRDRVKRKAALSQAGIRVPQSRRFGYKHVDEAIAYAQKFSRGVIIKPRAVSAGVVSRKALTDPDEIRESINAWQKSPGSGADYLVEARIQGPEYVFYIIAGRVESVVRRRNRAWTEEIYRNGRPATAEIAPDVLELAARSLRAMPRTPYGEVRITGRNALTDPDRYRVVSIRPTIELIGGDSTQEWSTHMADRLVAHGVGGALANLTHRKLHQAQLKVQLTATELSDPGRLAVAVKDWMDKTDVDGKLYVADRELAGSLTGTSGELASFSHLLRSGKLMRQFPQTVTLRHAGSAEGA